MILLNKWTIVWQASLSPTPLKDLSTIVFFLSSHHHNRSSLYLCLVVAPTWCTQRFISCFKSIGKTECFASASGRKTVKGRRDKNGKASKLTSLSADNRLLWSSTVGWAVLWSTCVGVDWLLSDETDTAVGLMVCVELFTGLDAKTGVLLTGGCCFFLSASYNRKKNKTRYVMNLTMTHRR